MTQRILRVSRVVPDLDRAEAFYSDAMGFRVTGRGPVDASTLAALGAGAQAPAPSPCGSARRRSR